jgi:hypothetical protein
MEWLIGGGLIAYLLYRVGYWRGFSEGRKIRVRRFERVPFSLDDD